MENKEIDKLDDIILFVGLLLMVVGCVYHSVAIGILMFIVYYICIIGFDLIKYQRFRIKTKKFHINITHYNLFSFSVLLKTKKWGFVIFEYSGCAKKWIFYTSPNAVRRYATYMVGSAVTDDMKKRAEHIKNRYGHNYNVDVYGSAIKYIGRYPADMYPPLIKNPTKEVEEQS